MSMTTADEIRDDGEGDEPDVRGRRGVRDRGATVVEYALMLAACALLGITGLGYLMQETNETFERVLNDVRTPQVTDSPGPPDPTTTSTTTTTTTTTTAPPCRRRCPR